MFFFEFTNLFVKKPFLDRMREISNLFFMFIDEVKLTIKA